VNRLVPSSPVSSFLIVSRHYLLNASIFWLTSRSTRGFVRVVRFW